MTLAGQLLFKFGLTALPLRMTKPSLVRLPVALYPLYSMCSNGSLSGSSLDSGLVIGSKSLCPNAGKIILASSIWSSMALFISSTGSPSVGLLMFTTV